MLYLFPWVLLIVTTISFIPGYQNLVSFDSSEISDKHS